MEVVVRLPRLQDYERVSKIMDQVQQLHVEWRPDVYKPASPLITMDMFEAILKDENWYVAEADGVVVGVLELMKRHVESPAQVMKDVLFISTMAVDEKYRGKGIGHLFFEKVKRLKQEKGYDTIELQVNAKNRLAYEMYRKYGFTEKSINMELKESALG
jgi:ribosomal protein S18 acetylase RimI-like enzyme